MVLSCDALIAAMSRFSGCAVAFKALAFDGIRSTLATPASVALQPGERHEGRVELLLTGKAVGTYHHFIRADFDGDWSGRQPRRLDFDLTLLERRLAELSDPRVTIDTGGLEPGTHDGIFAEMARQATVYRVRSSTWATSATGKAKTSRSTKATRSDGVIDSITVSSAMLTESDRTACSAGSSSWAGRRL